MNSARVETLRRRIGRLTWLFIAGLVLSGATVHLLDNVHQPISATAIRQAASAKKPLKKFVDPRVEEYIKKMGLY